MLPPISYGKVRAVVITPDQLRDAKLDYTIKGRLTVRLAPEVVAPDRLVEPKENYRPVPHGEAGHVELVRKR